MANCIVAREVDIRLRDKKGTHATKDCRVVCPATWTKNQFLTYVRKEHPQESVRVLDWYSHKALGDMRNLWMVNPKEMV